MTRMWPWSSRSKKVDLRSSNSLGSRTYSTLIDRYRRYRTLITWNYYIVDIVDRSRIIDDLFIITIIPCLSRSRYNSTTTSTSTRSFGWTPWSMCTTPTNTRRKDVLRIRLV